MDTSTCICGKSGDRTGWGQPDCSPQSPSERPDWQTHNAVLPQGGKKRGVKAGGCGGKGPPPESQRALNSPD
ncbi:hypothetical protein EYF80_044400 [Liparis tanakae]|uniref:Uncharacterized protein n=1 Tax=Liparis tanakae TaxID=230148 RepID=A0A4Z2FXE7_9TELE|nr:hypothetical protein EYF80_044400 [Liparis tanakae]